MAAIRDLTGFTNANVDLPTQYPAIPSPTTDPAAMLLTVQRLKESVELLTGQRTPKLAGMNQAVLELRSQNGNLSATIREVYEVNTANGEALAQRTLTLEADMDAAEARITEVDTARVNGDEALAQRALTIETHLGETDARVQEVDQARSDGDNALASHLNTVEATANQGTAFGAISITAQAGLDGVFAAYSWNIKANNVQAGMWATVDGAGTGNIMFLADRFRLYKPGGGPLPVFDYYGNGFTFNGNVLINGNLVVTGTINTGQIAGNAVSQIASAGGGGGTAVGMNCRGGSYYVLAIYDGSAQRFGIGTVTPGNLYLGVDGVAVASVPVGYEASGNNDNVSVAVLPTPIARTLFVGAGGHTFSAWIDGSVGTQVTIVVIELLR
jgi:hypothetical protein